MKKVYYFMTVALLALCAKSAYAQEDFYDFFDNASNFYLIWLDESTESWYEISPRIAGDYRINDNERFIDIWDAGETYSIKEPTGKGYFDQNGGYANYSANDIGWAGGGFRSDAPVDLTKINGNYRFHIVIRKTNTDACRINLFGGGKSDGKADESQRAQFIVGEGDHVYEDEDKNRHENLTPDFKVNTWQVIDIPVSDLMDMGWNNRSAFTGYYFTYDFGDVNYNNLQFDGVFYYYPSSTPPAGINDAQAGNNKLDVVVTNKTVSVLNATAPIEVYNVAGIKVKTCEQPVFGTDEVNKGIYIIKSGNAVAKVIIK